MWCLIWVVSRTSDKLCFQCSKPISVRNGTYCSSTCMYTHRLQKKEAQCIEFNCKFCNKVNKNYGKAYMHQFCNKTCSTRWKVANGTINASILNSKSWIDWYRIKHGEEKLTLKLSEFKELKRIQSIGERNGMFGKHHSVVTTTLMSLKRNGVSLEERLGHEKAVLTKAKMSKTNSGPHNGMFGKTSVSTYRTNRGINGFYKGRNFRSLYELSFMKYLENRGIALDEILYENIKIPYEYLGIQRTYVTDFYVPKLLTLYEVKTSSEINNLSDVNRVKFAAAYEFCSSNGIQFITITEKDFPCFGQKHFHYDQDITFNSPKFKERNLMNTMGKRLADSVLHRVIQIVQEGMLIGIDVSDLMRQIRLVDDDENQNVLVLSPEYQKQVRDMHEKLLADVKKLQADSPVRKLILDGSEPS